MSEEQANIWWARGDDPLFLANVNGEEIPSLVTFKNGIYQHLCPREGTPYTKAENIRQVKVVPLDYEADLKAKVLAAVEGLDRYGLIYEDVDFGKSSEGDYLSRAEVIQAIKGAVE